MELVIDDLLAGFCVRFTMQISVVEILMWFGYMSKIVINSTQVHVHALVTIPSFVLSVKSARSPHGEQDVVDEDCKYQRALEGCAQGVGVEQEECRQRGDTSHSHNSGFRGSFAIAAATRAELD
jgi:hypothetical protein